MSNGLDAGRASGEAGRLLAAGAVADPWTLQHARVLQAIAVMSPAGVQVAWFVGAGVADQLVGYVLLDPAGRLVKWSSFQRHAGSLAECPDVAAWTDPAAIAQVAAVFLGTSDGLEVPVLSFDGVIDRLAWRVRAIDGDGKARTVCVTGTVAFACA